MKIIADTHAHTIVSGHAYSTIREMAAAGAEHGLELLALTEHAPEMPGSCGIFYFQNYNVIPREMCGIRMLFGVELNIMDTEGTVDMPDWLCEKQDIVVASLHSPCYGQDHTKEENTTACVNAMKNPHINIIGHPDDGRLPLDYEAIVKTAKETHTLLELNNSSLKPDGFRVNARENMIQMLGLCKKYGVSVSTGSDAHIDVDAGNFKYIQEVLDYCEFPEELVANTSLKKLQPYINRQIIC
ncbi:MAG: phosphatase [Hespellia sp.]|nr:phosphatase [Hespellia sp.]